MHQHGMARTIAKRKPSQTKVGMFFTKLMLFVGLTPLIIWSPQIIKVYRTQDVESLSLSTLSLFSTMSALWFLYGIQQEDQPLIMSGGFGCLCTMSIIVGIFLYS